MSSAEMNIGTLRPEWLDVTRSYDPEKRVFQYSTHEQGIAVEGRDSVLEVGSTITCTIENNEVMLSCPKVDSSRSVPIDALGLSEKDQANLMAQALYMFAQNGYDPDSNARASACHIIDDTKHPQKDGRPTKRIFIAANANHRARSQRFDAEAIALAEAKNVLGVGNFMVRQTYLTLHQPKAPGEIMTPCGTCREELTDKAYIAEDAELYCIPLGQKGGAKEPVLPDMSGVVFEIDDQTGRSDPNPAETPNGHIFKQKTHDLVPHKNVYFPKELEGKRTLDILRDGLKWVWAGTGEHDGQARMGYYRPIKLSDQQLAKMQQAESTGHNAEITYLEGEGFTLERVNDFLLNKIKAAYFDLVDREGVKAKDVEKIRTSLVVLEDGRCFASLYIDGKGLGAKPLGEMSALSNAYNPTTVKEVFVMDMNPKQILEDMTAERPYARGVYPEALDRIFKSAKVPQGKWSERTHQDITGQQINGRCMLHTLPLNDGSLREETLKEAMQSHTIEELYPGPYKAANSMAVGCC